MCGFAGWINNKSDISKNKKIIKKMTNPLKYRGPDSTGYYIDKHILLGHKRLAIIDIKNGKQPMKYKNYVIVYNGELYNTLEIKNKLIKEGYTFDTTSDTEVLLKGYVHYKEKILDMIDGIFAFCIYDGEKLFMARDEFGVKPLFYTLVKGSLLFASEIKSLLEHKLVKPIIDKKSLQELLALGPSKIPGSGIFKNIKEIRPAHYLIYKKNKIEIKRYWNVKDKKQDNSFEKNVKKVRELLTKSIKTQMVSDVGISTFLSGGLDSSIITAICSNELQKENKTLDTYSIDYEGNQKYFKSNKFQISRDNTFIDLMSEKFKTNHHYEVITQKTLAKMLKNSVIARDYPGMADIDSSLLWFSEQVRKKHKVVLSGECADEIFGGYPWFYREEIRNRENFPWINNLDERISLLNKNIKNKLNLKKFVEEEYNKSINEMPKCKNKKEEKFKQLFYINMLWFMPTLLERKDRMTMGASLEARVPFANKKLVEYLWNIPWENKFHDNQEKGLLREAFKDLLPKEIIERKKNPYPKTHNPEYATIVTNLLKKSLKNKKSILYKVFDKDELEKLVKTKGSSFKLPWYGQLMSGPQLIAYLYQFDYWAKKYKVILEI